MTPETDTPSPATVASDENGVSSPMDPGDTVKPGSVPMGMVSGRNEETRFLWSLRRIIRALGNHSRRMVVEHGITSPQLICLLRLKETGPVSMKGLAREVDLSPSTVVGIIDRLELRGLVRRERVGKDRRVVTLSITDSGCALLNSAPSPLQDALSLALKSHPHEESARLAATLEQIVDLMEIREVEPVPLYDVEGMFSKAAEFGDDLTSGLGTPDNETFGRK
ncbi:MAG: winged helix-turn-helix transcriptional regulator [Candidatus Sumerlaeia bacterium]|nr:winged helix-turn-helix transcriptional regulator [Candidatus Sumerlaeia bacterium]